MLTDGCLRWAEVPLQRAQPAAIHDPGSAAVALLLRAHDADRGPATTDAAVTAATASAAPSAPEATFRRRARLRTANNTAARRLAYPSGLEFAEVNRRLNATIGVRGIKDATPEQLEQRPAAAQAWAGGTDDAAGVS